MRGNKIATSALITATAAIALACGVDNGRAQQAVPTNTPVATPTATAVPTATPTTVPTPSPTATAIPTATATATAVPTNTPTPTAIPTATPIPYSLDTQVIPDGYRIIQDGNRIPERDGREITVKDNGNYIITEIIGPNERVGDEYTEIRVEKFEAGLRVERSYSFVKDNGVIGHRTGQSFYDAEFDGRVDSQDKRHGYDSNLSWSVWSDSFERVPGTEQLARDIDAEYVGLITDLGLLEVIE